jgi:uncharacterized protein YkwD
VLGVLVTFLVTGLSPSPAESKGLRRRLYHLIEHTRKNHGVHGLRLDRDLSKYCRRHTVDMVQQNRLYHSTNLAGRVGRYNAKYWGENVGYAGTLRRLVRLWLRSPDHRANLLDRHFRFVGIGIVRARGWVWSTTTFYG